MPLGIELAAAWVPVLPCAEIAREMLVHAGKSELPLAVREFVERAA